jgi:hypothetical protein
MERLMNAPKKIWMAKDDAFDEYTHQFDGDIPYIRADLVDGLVEALSQITDVYTAMRENLSKMYPKDGWSTETLTLDKARAALAKLEEE